MPSITVEETAAASISDANMLAPQEIAGKNALTKKYNGIFI